MKTRVLTIISVGITIGFLLGMSVIALLRALLDGDSAELEISFTALTGCMVLVADVRNQDHPLKNRRFQRPGRISTFATAFSPQKPIGSVPQ